MALLFPLDCLHTRARLKSQGKFAIPRIDPHNLSSPFEMTPLCQVFSRSQGWNPIINVPVLRFEGPDKNGKWHCTITVRFVDVEGNRMQAKSTGVGPRKGSAKHSAFASLLETLWPNGVHRPGIPHGRDEGQCSCNNILNTATSPAPEMTPGVYLPSADWILVNVSKIDSAHAKLRSNSSEFPAPVFDVSADGCPNNPRSIVGDEFVGVVHEAGTETGFREGDLVAGFLYGHVVRPRSAQAVKAEPDEAKAEPNEDQTEALHSLKTEQAEPEMLTNWQCLLKQQAILDKAKEQEIYLRRCLTRSFDVPTIFMAISLVATEDWTQNLAEIGIASWKKTKGSLNIKWGVQGTLPPSAVVRHFRVAALVDRTRKPNQTGSFLFGHLETLPIATLRDVLQYIVLLHEKEGNVVLVGHDPRRDAQVLWINGIDVFDHALPDIIDISRLWKSGSSRADALYGLAKDLGWRNEGFYNVGNDAAAILFVLLRWMETIVSKAIPWDLW